ncbi:hypothetical protein ACFOSD_03490 [Salinispirillum marinum]|uniref:MSHA biogenesis protein MshI n=2 Tax=Saccharospirillaceae TaxID=255527 RepID=A0ABV8BCA9_9GAMM
MQYINLIPRQQRHRYTLTPRALMGVLVLALLGVAVMTYLGWQRQQDAESVLLSETMRLQTLQQDIARLQQVLPPPVDLDALQQQVNQQQQERTAQQARLNDLQSIGVLSSPSYYDFLRSLSRQRINGVWLTQFSLDTRTVPYQVELTGAAERTDLLPVYLEGLASEERQIALRFRGLQLAQLQENAEYYRFALSTQAIVPEAEAGAGLPGLPANQTPRLPGTLGLIQGFIQ